MKIGKLLEIRHQISTGKRENKEDKTWGDTKYQIVFSLWLLPSDKEKRNNFIYTKFNTKLKQKFGFPFLYFWFGGQGSKISFRWCNFKVIQFFRWNGNKLAEDK